MTNDELAAAIAYASERIRETAPNEEQHHAFTNHLHSLLATQRKRAEGEKP